VIVRVTNHREQNRTQLGEENSVYSSQAAMAQTLCWGQKKSPDEQSGIPSSQQAPDKKERPHIPTNTTHAKLLGHGRSELVAPH